MIDAERMLGSLVRNAMGGGRRRGRRRRRRGSSLLGGVGKGSLALGALGVAMGAFEHFSQKQGVGAETGASPPPAQPPLPPVPTSPATDDRATAQPPLPPLPPIPGGDGPAPVPTPEASAPAGSSADEALLMVRAMIAAANADHELDDEERRRILEALEEAEAGEEEKAFARQEIEDPIDLATLAAQATTPELANQVYLASLMAIEVDTQAERNYLRRLARRLGIAPERVRELEAMFGGEADEAGEADRA